jgi:hypothetical protein
MWQELPAFVLESQDMWSILSIPSCIFGHSDSMVVKGQCLVSSVCWQGEQEHVLSAVMTGCADTLFWMPLWRGVQTLDFLVSCSETQPLRLLHFFYDVAYLRIGLLNDAVWMTVLTCLWDVMTTGIGRWWSVLHESTYTGFFCNGQGKPKTSVRLAAIPVAIWAEFCFLIWSQRLSTRS